MKALSKLLKLVLVIFTLGFCVVLVKHEKRRELKLPILGNLSEPRGQERFRSVEKDWVITQHDNSSIIWRYPKNLGGGVAKWIVFENGTAITESDYFPTLRSFPSADSEGTSFEECVVRFFYDTKLCSVYAITDDDVVKKLVEGNPTSPGISTSEAHELVSQILKRWKIEAFLAPKE